MESWKPLRRHCGRQRSLDSLLVWCVAVLCLSCLSGGRADESQAPVVRIENGLLAGKRISVLGKDVDAFLGIPYALPPIGNLRFEKPQPADAWEGTFQAVNKPPPCRQLDMPFLAGTRLHYSNTTTEDCLYANVWRPSSSCPHSESCGAKLPVIVFIHGGALQWGDSSLFLHDPSVFVRRIGCRVRHVQLPCQHVRIPLCQEPRPSRQHGNVGSGPPLEMGSEKHREVRR
ncbi:hypothetical protein MTO96_021481 [Rhipicephalus appendiculatus]